MSRTFPTFLRKCNDFSPIFLINRNKKSEHLSCKLRINCSKRNLFQTKELSAMVKKSLAHLKPGESAIIECIKTEQENRKRLQDLGFVPGVTIQCLQQNFSGSSSTYLIHGTVIALQPNGCYSNFYSGNGIGRTTRRKDHRSCGKSQCGKEHLV